jgi:hypothetical protein
VDSLRTSVAPSPEAWLYLEETGNPSSRRVGIFARGLAPAKDCQQEIVTVCFRVTEDS